MTTVMASAMMAMMAMMTVMVMVMMMMMDLHLVICKQSLDEAVS